MEKGLVTEWFNLTAMFVSEWCVGGGSMGVVGAEAGRGVVLGGGARGWLPDVAAVMWRRMLGALGDPNLLPDPSLHSQVFQYLLHLNDTLLKVPYIPIS